MSWDVVARLARPSALRKLGVLCWSDPLRVRQEMLWQEGAYDSLVGVCCIMMCHFEALFSGVMLLVIFCITEICLFDRNCGYVILVILSWQFKVFENLPLRSYPKMLIIIHYTTLKIHCYLSLKPIFKARNADSNSRKCLTKH